MVEINNARDTTKTVRSGVEYVKFWGWIKGDSRRKLVRIDKNLKSKRCISLLWSDFLSDFKDDDLVQYDGESGKKKVSWV